MENAEYGVDSRYKSEKQRKEESSSLMEARMERLKKMPRCEIIRSRLLQLKLKLETFLKK